MKEKAHQHSPSLSACSAPASKTITSTSTVALSSSASSTTYALRAQLSHLRADCDVSCAKRYSKRMASALKSCTMSGAGDDWITFMGGRGGVGGTGASSGVIGG